MNRTGRAVLPAASARLPQDHPDQPPGGFPGLDPRWSRIVRADTESGPRRFHVLDTGPVLEARGLTVSGTILALHGNPTWSYFWRHVVRESLQRARPGSAWRVIAPDQLDMGFSDRLAHSEPPSPDAVSYRRLSQRLGDLDGIVEALAVDTDSPLVTLGHDWGGIVSLGWAVRHDRDVDAAITLNTAVDHPVDDAVPDALRLAMAPGLLGASTVSTEAFLGVTLGLAQPGLPPEVRRAYRAPYTTRSGRGGIGGFVADIPADRTHPSRPALEGISAGLRDWKKPLLLLWGPRDPVFQDRYLADIRDRVPAADLHRYEGAGHMLTEDRPVQDAIFTWLDDHFGSTPARADKDDAGTGGPGPSGPSAAPSAVFDQLRELSTGDHRGAPATVDMTAPDPETRTVSWEQLAERVSALAAGLEALGVRPGQRVSLLVQPGNDLTVILYACLRIGAVVVVVDAGLGLRGMTRAARAARPDWIIGETPGLGVARTLRWPGHRLSVRELSGARAAALGTIGSVAGLLGRHAGESPRLPVPDAAAPAAVLFTSGSTGPAKGVRYTHGRLGALMALIREQFGVEPGTSLIAGFAPFALLGPGIGATSVTPDMVVTKPATLSASAVADAASAGGASMLFASPAALRNIVATESQLSADQRAAMEEIGLVLSAGAPVHPDLLDAVQEVLPAAELHTPYGMTEGLLQADITREQVHRALAETPAAERAGVCVGRPVRGVRFAVAPLDQDGVPAPAPQDPASSPGVLAEILVSAGHLTAGYDALWLTDRRSRRDSDAERRWHRTNDVGHFDRSGRLWIQGRLQHVILGPAGPLGPGAVETPVDALPGVSRSAAVGVGPAGTQAVAVIVEPAGPLADAVTPGSPLASVELAAAVRAAVPGTPVAAVLVRPELPTDIRHNSKIDRTALAAWAERVLSGGKVSSR